LIGSASKAAAAVMRASGGAMSALARGLAAGLGALGLPAELAVSRCCVATARAVRAGASAAAAIGGWASALRVRRGEGCRPRRRAGRIGGGGGRRTGGPGGCAGRQRHRARGRDGSANALLRGQRRGRPPAETGIPPVYLAVVLVVIVAVAGVPYARAGGSPQNLPWARSGSNLPGLMRW